MEIVRNSDKDTMFKINNKYGKLPKELEGAFTSIPEAAKAIRQFQASVRSKVKKRKHESGNKQDSSRVQPVEQGADYGSLTTDLS